MARKEFRIDDETLKNYNNLKEKENLTNDSDFFRKMVDYTDKFLNQKVVSVEILQEKEREIRSLYARLGELQGELNIYKQQALPKKSFWKKLFGG